MQNVAPLQDLCPPLPPGTAAQHGRLPAPFTREGWSFRPPASQAELNGENSASAQIPRRAPP